MCYNSNVNYGGWYFMGDNKTKKSGDKSYIIKRIIDLVLAAILVIGVIFGIKAVTGDFSDIDRKDIEGENDQIQSSNLSAPQQGTIIYATEMMDNDIVNSGSLIVVNDKVEYKGNEDDLVSMYDIRESDGTKSYDVMSADVRLRKDAASALNDMVKAFASETNHDDIVIDGGYRSVKYQQELYDDAEDKSTAAKPGFSDYHTGYSIDFGIGNEEGMVDDFEGKDDYSWFEKNCYRYGFILRYPDGKKDKTGFDYRPWHFRYVGTEHAYYMYKNNLCLEEYIDKLKNYEYTKSTLTFSDDNGKEYEVYYYPADTSTSFTMVAVPSEMKYNVSGNNSDGFIICFDKNQTVDNSSDENSKDDSKDDKSSNESKTDEKDSKTESNDDKSSSESKADEKDSSSKTDS